MDEKLLLILQTGKTLEYIRSQIVFLIGIFTAK